MSFPNLPNVPGVPAINRLNTKAALLDPVNVFNAALTRVPYLEGLLQFALAEKWGIYDTNGNLVLEPDTIISIGRNAPTRVAEFQIEQGSFASYNKVRESEKYPVVMIKTGSSSERSAFIAQVEELRDTTKVVNVVTPEKTAVNYTLESINYVRSTQDGVTMIVFNLVFVEIREVSILFTTQPLPSLSNSTQRGLQQAKIPRASILSKAAGLLGG